MSSQPHPWVVPSSLASLVTPSSKYSSIWNWVNFLNFCFLFSRQLAPHLNSNWVIKERPIPVAELLGRMRKYDEENEARTCWHPYVFAVSDPMIEAA